MTHNELLDSLAYFKGSIFKTIFLENPQKAYWEKQKKFRELALTGDMKGFRELRNEKNTSAPQADLIVIANYYNIEIYEVKATRADFLSDIRTKKWEKYLNYCHRFYFACLSGICKKNEIPEPAGLYTWSGNWHGVKAAKQRDIDYNIDMLLAMLNYKQKN
jgi:hypothetical protein